MLKIGFFGDSVFGIENLNLSNFQSILQILKNNQFNIINLESPISPPKFRTRKKNIVLKTLVSNIQVLHQLKIGITCLANNHITDLFEKGVKFTLKMLSDNKIQYFGIENEKKSYNPLILGTKETNIGLLGYGSKLVACIPPKNNHFGVPPIKLNKIKNDIENLRKKVDYIIISLHWGDELEKYPNQFQRDIAHSIIDFGADLIIGNHAHYLQGYEIYEGKHIFYCLGNFFLPDNQYYNGYFLKYPSISRFSLSIHFNFSKDGYTFKIIPIMYNHKNNKLELPSSKSINLILRYIENYKKLFDLDRKDYSKYVNKNRRRKDLPYLGNNKFIRSIKIFLYYYIFVDILIIFSNSQIFKKVFSSLKSKIKPNFD